MATTAMTNTNDTPTAERRGDWMQTFTGRAFWPLDPRPEDVDIEDIAHALSHQARFAGHTISFYSVADHSIRVANAVPPEHALWGLLHDAAEAYCVDVPRPMKRHLSGYSEIEARVMRAICDRFGLAHEMPEAVKHADDVLLATEKRDLLAAPPRPWKYPLPAPLATSIVPRTSSEARGDFLMLFRALTGARRDTVPAPTMPAETCATCAGHGMLDDRGFPLTGQPVFDPMPCPVCRGGRAA